MEKESNRLKKLKALNADRFLILAEEWRYMLQEVTPNADKLIEMLKEEKKSRKK